jgi:PAS domain S-box-containing protein
MSCEEQPPRDQPDWYQVALTSIGDAVVVTDAGGRVTLLNPAAEALTGWPRGDAVGQPLAEILHIVNERTRRPVADPVTEVLARGVAVDLADHTVLIARDGTERLIGDNAAPIRDRDGGVAGAVLIFRDVGEHRRAERAAEDALAYAEAIVETVREPLVVLDASLRVRTANRAYYLAFRADPAATEGRFLYDLGDRQWDVPQLRGLLEEVLPRDSRFDDLEVEREFDGVGRRTMLLSARQLDGRGARTGLILLAIEDVTERRRAAHDLTVSETRYRRLFETAQDGILIIDARTGRIFDANPFLTELLGYPHAELVGKELWEIGLFEEIGANRAAFRELQAKGYIRYEDLPLRTEDGRHIDVEFVSNVYQVDGRAVIQCNIREVTDRKRAEEAVREAHERLEDRVRERTAELSRANEALAAEIARRERAEAARQELLQRLAAAGEEERRRIARELHDQTGQHLTALSLGLKSLGDATPEASPARQRIEQLKALTALLGKEVHDLALELRPTALDDLGLHTALVNYAEEWSSRSGVPVDYHGDGLDAERLPPLIETALYRVVQESLTNVFRHAQARRVSLILRRSRDQVFAVIEDNGRGFDPEGGVSGDGAGGRLGLLGMRERVELVGGALTVESAPGRGTTVFARIPLRAGGEGVGDG